MFRGDPDHPGTRIYRCISVECDRFTDTREGYCVSCRVLLRGFGGDEDALAEYFRGGASLGRRVGLETLSCKVKKDGRRCSRTRVAAGLCDTHFTKWRTYSGKGITAQQFLLMGVAKPLDHFGKCLVGACARERASRLTLLCQSHETQFKREVLSAGPVDDVASAEREFAVDRPPIHALGNFCLLALPDEVRHEYLVAIQAEDRAGYSVQPALINRSIAVLLAAGVSIADAKFEEAIPSPKGRGDGMHAFLRRVALTVRTLRAQFDGVDPSAGDIWDSFEVGLPSKAHLDGRAQAANARKFVTKRQKIDFTPISQPWLRELVKCWARELRPPTVDVHSAILGFVAVSDALALRPGGDDPSTAHVRDIQKALELIHGLKRGDGEPYSSKSVARYWSLVRRVLDYLRASGHMDHIHPGFSITPAHRVVHRTPPTGDDAPGRALPYRVVNALLAALPSLPEGARQTGSMLSGHDLLRLHQTALRTLIDTGRRPGEVVSLKVGCVTMSPSTSGSPGSIDYTLTYDNHKAGRDGRAIPITVDTAKVILDWETHRKTLSLPKSYDRWLFPSPSVGRVDADRHLTTGGLARALSRLVASVPRLEGDLPDHESGGYLRFSGEIVPYSFRHSYAQRHADAGVDPDTLRELMDHKSMITTTGYYKVGAKRKREAIAKLAPLAINQDGHSAPFDSPVAYELSSVAVPFGGCTDPTNVKAGGSSCPIRFQCAGCAAYRPDASYLPAIEEHLVTMRATLQMVLIAGTAAPWVVQNQRDEIESFERILTALKKQIEAMPDDERSAVADASSAMRKLRATRPLLPLTVRNSNG